MSEMRERLGEAVAAVVQEETDKLTSLGARRERVMIVANLSRMASRAGMKGDMQGAMLSWCYLKVADDIEKDGRYRDSMSSSRGPAYVISAEPAKTSSPPDGGGGGQDSDVAE